MRKHHHEVDGDLSVGREQKNCSTLMSLPRQECAYTMWADQEGTSFGRIASHFHCMSALHHRLI